MAHYAFLNMNNIVTEVIVGKNETDGNLNWELYYQSLRFQVCKRTSYNTLKGVHKLGGLPFRKNFAGIGYTYNEARDAFIPPKPYTNWVLNNDTCTWDAPLEYPADGNDYIWDEASNNWILD